MWTWNFKNTGHKPTAGAYQPSMSIKFQITYICEVGGSDSSAPIQHITSVEARKTLHAWFLSLQMRTKTFQCAEIPRKFLTSIFWDQDGILTDYLPKGQTINAEYYSSLLVQLKDIWKEKCHGKDMTMPWLTGHLQPRRNWPIWASSVLITHPILRIWPCWTTTCSLDWKKQLKVHHFLSNKEVIAAAETWLDVQPSELFFFEWLAKVRVVG